MTPRSFRASTLALALVLASCTERGTPPSTMVDAFVPRADANGTDAGAPACTRDLDCADRIACSIDHCEAGVCTHEPCLDCCDDGLVCDTSLGCVTAPEACTTDEECRDTVRCTLDACRDATACEHIPSDALCGAGEICLPAVGCIPTPPTSCTSAADCEVGARCVGEWNCEVEFGCVYVSSVSCDDADDCTIDSCVEDRGGCVHDPRDDDRDGETGVACGGADCDDMDASRNSGAAEVCGDGVDQDCDGTIDDGCCTTGPCTTACGTTGSLSCPDAVCVPPAEACNGTDDDCNGARDDGFACALGATEACTTACGSIGVRSCASDCSGWGACIAPTEACNGADDDCDGVTDDGFTCAAGSTGPCPTACGSTGTRMCTSACGWDLCAPPAEACNGTDDDCNGARDDGFACALGATEACTTACGSIGVRSCASNCSGWGACIAPTETCNGADDDCDGATDDGFTCAAGSSGPCPTACGSTGTRMCTSACGWDLCAPPAEACNGMDDDCDGACDDGFACCRGSTRDCTALGFYAGTAVCRSNCGAFDTSTCTNCGNGLRDAPEVCDGLALGGASCTSLGLGFSGGTLRCAPGCAMFDTSGCVRCGNNLVDAGETCDGTALGGATCASLGMGFTGGTLRCNAGCGGYDTALCTVFSPTGTYAVSPAPVYTCVFGLVNFDGTSMSLSLSGSTMTLTMTGLPCSPSGIWNASTRAFDLTCTAPGTCAETYRLTGTFSTDNTWSGTFRASYAGGAGACYDCSNRMWSVTGTR